MGDTTDLDQALAAVVQSLSGVALQTCTAAAAAPILQIAQERVRVRHGDVRDRLGTVTTHTAASATTAVQVADSGKDGVAHEAVFLEYGTRRMAARPFLRPAFDTGKAAAVSAFTATLQSNLKGFQ